MRKLIFSLAVALIATHTASADIIATFDVDAEGWKVVDIAPSWGDPPVVQATYVPDHRPSGGAPGGYIESTDSNPAWFCFAASDAFLGDRGAYYGGRLSMDLQATASDDATYPLVILVGGGLSLYHATPPPASSWTSFSVDLAAGSWRVNNHETGPAVTEAQMRTVLADLTAIYINGDWLSGTETAGLDNVRLSAVPEPGGLTLALAGMIVVALARRRIIG
jgi:hypothetical protein